MSPEFEWNDDKAALNQKKHRVSFEEPATVLPTHSPRFSTTRSTRRRSIARFSLAIR
jgi:uncharacterized DUF497 family protein